MEQWEIDYRKELEETVPDGAYDISSPGWVCWTGKQGYINYLVEFKRQTMCFEAVVDQIERGDITCNTELTEQELKDFIDELKKGYGK